MAGPALAVGTSIAAEAAASIAVIVVADDTAGVEADLLVVRGAEDTELACIHVCRASCPANIPACVHNALCVDKMF